MANLGLHGEHDSDLLTAEDERRAFWRRHGRSPSPRGEKVVPEWVKWALGVIGAAVVSYYTTIGTMQGQISRLEEREGNHYTELLRMMTDMRTDLKEIKNSQGK